ncbi:hypothetical protein GT93_08105 [Pseudomonas plecoglossicida]|nr:hypothetical protein GT93_08105 [Pseudomonas plecoglossicida]
MTINPRSGNYDTSSPAGISLKRCVVWERFSVKKKLIKLCAIKPDSSRPLLGVVLICQTNDCLLTIIGLPAARCVDVLSLINGVEIPIAVLEWRSIISEYGRFWRRQ